VLVRCGRARRLHAAQFPFMGSEPSMIMPLPKNKLGMRDGAVQSGHEMFGKAERAAEKFDSRRGIAVAHRGDCGAMRVLGELGH
jgi:hypothetical protein